MLSGFNIEKDDGSRSGSFAPTMALAAGLALLVLLPQAASAQLHGSLPELDCEYIFPAVDLEKSTQGQDADVGPGPQIPVGQPVEWTYRVTNTGNALLYRISVADDRGVMVFCPTSRLAPNATMVCIGRGTAVAGPYRNVGAVAAIAGDRCPVVVTDQDPSHYVGVEARP